jgi:hypothetical protein
VVEDDITVTCAKNCAITRQINRVDMELDDIACGSLSRFIQQTQDIILLSSFKVPPFNAPGHEFI